VNELKKYQIGEWCKRAAWIVAIVGIVDIFVGTVVLFIQNSSYGSNAIPLLWFLPQVLHFILGAIPTPLFDALILYAAGVVVNRFLAYTEGNEKTNDAMPNKLENGRTSYSTVPPKGKNDGVAQAAVETAAAKTSLTQPEAEESDVTQAAETTPAQSEGTESNVVETTGGDNTPETTPAQPRSEEGDVTAVEVENTAANSATTQAEDKKSKVAAGNAKSKAKK
jgi:xanthosine utilization system XapX-like protein